MKKITKAFRRQNPALVEHLTKAECISLGWYIEHHSGGLLVAGQYVDVSAFSAETIYVKLHDSWGDPEDPDGGPIVVHIYDTNESPLGDVMLYFTSGVDATSLFLNDGALAAIWKATR